MNLRFPLKREHSGVLARWAARLVARAFLRGKKEYQLSVMRGSVGQRYETITVPAVNIATWILERAGYQVMPNQAIELQDRSWRERPEC